MEVPPKAGQQCGGEPTDQILTDVLSWWSIVAVNMTRRRRPKADYHRLVVSLCRAVPCCDAH
jgi:hypothetical protein